MIIVKKWLAFLILLLAFLLSYCQKRTSFSLSQPENAVKKIEIIAVDPYRFYNHEDSRTFKILQTINPVQHGSFLKELYDVPCYRYRNDPLQGFDQHTVRVTYLDGSYELIGSRTVYYKTPDGAWKYPPYYFDEEAFVALIAKYSQ